MKNTLSANARVCEPLEGRPPCRPKPRPRSGVSRFALLPLAVLFLSNPLFAAETPAQASPEEQSGGNTPPVTAAALSPSEPKPGDADYPKGGDNPRHLLKIAAVKSGDYDLVLIGDSITACIGDSDNPEWLQIKAVWEKYYAPRKALNLGYGGCRTENILWNLMNGELEFKRPPKVFRLLIGTNNLDDQHYKTIHSAEQVFAGTKAIVDLIRSKFPDSKIIVQRILPSGGANDKTPYKRVYCRSEKASQALKDAGAMTAKLADDKNVFWVDLNPVFLNPDGTINSDLMPDLIHPNLAGHEAMAKALEPTLARLLGDKPILD